MTHIVSKVVVNVVTLIVLTSALLIVFAKVKIFLLLTRRVYRLCSLYPWVSVEAIFAEEDVPEDQKEFIEINAELSKI